MHIDVQLLKKRLYEDSHVKNVKFFPGSSRDASPEDYAGEINKYFAGAENGSQSFDPSTDLDA